jgi:hypothetical protein
MTAVRGPGAPPVVCARCEYRRHPPRGLVERTVAGERDHWTIQANFASFVELNVEMFHVKHDSCLDLA